ncbi:SUMF1/EgtB/PvdO family nonheme iron enzyme [Shewanella oncorhynchi]|uniref:SUMF1/EgtB/PvdO family nonheme iron enzyme n=1 Tax=Shewanella oncorhynchi TaxID=2726434 RepID=UPI003D799AB5
MTIATINLGTAPSGVGGDAARNAFEKVNANFSQTENAASRTVGTANDNQVLDKAGLQILIKDPRRQEVEALSGGKNTVIYDAQGNPNVMVVFPRYNVEDLGLTALNLGTGTHPAFTTNGAPRGEILIPKYLASAGGSTCSVIGGVQPLTSVNYDQAKARCTGKGANWHMMSVHEWAAIALWSLANGTVPRGNTNYGRAHDRLFETARRSDNGVPGDSAGTGRTDTGKGPAAWTHDHTVHGIHDLCGNVAEWLDQMVLVDGMIKTTLDNNPSILEANFVSHPAFYDSTATTGGAPRLNSSIVNRLGAVGDNSNTGNAANIDFKLLAKEASYVPSELLRRLLLETASQNTLAGRLTVRNFGNRYPARGGDWSFGSSAGLSALYLSGSSSFSNIGFGFRPAYFA